MFDEKKYMKKYNKKRLKTKEYQEYQKKYHSDREYLDKLKEKRDCIEYKEYQKSYVRPHSKKHKILTAGIKNEDRLTYEQYEQKLKLQNGLCAICGNKETRPNKNGEIARLCIDHDHTTGKIRELLCGKCNLVLGNASDNVEILLKSVEYLKKWGTK